MKGSLEDELQATVTGYDDVTQESINANSEITGLSQALFPVWLLHTLYKDEDYLFAMNGQTGRFIGDLPVSPLKVVLWFLGIFLVCMAILIGLDVSVFQFDDELTSVLVDFGIRARHRNLRVHRLLQSDEDGPRADRRARLHHDGRAHAHWVQ